MTKAVSIYGGGEYESNIGRKAKHWVNHPCAMHIVHPTLGSCLTITALQQRIPFESYFSKIAGNSQVFALVEFSNFDRSNFVDRPSVT